MKKMERRRRLSAEDCSAEAVQGERAERFRILRARRAGLGEFLRMASPPEGAKHAGATITEVEHA